MKVRHSGSTHGHIPHASQEAKAHANKHSAVQGKGKQGELKKLEDEVAALLQKLQAFEKKYFGDGFDPSSSGQSSGGAAPVGAGGGAGNTGIVGPTRGSGGGGGGGGAVAGSGGVGGSGGIGGIGAAPGNTGVVGPSAPGGTGNVVAGAAGIATDDPRLAQALDMIYSDPDGKKLIDAAKAAGLTRIITNPGLNPDGGAGTQGETFSGPNGQRIEIANPGSPDLIQTLAHELGHAATPQDGDSQTEEATVDALGNQIQQRLIGRAANFQLDAGAYSNLQADNGIKLDLRQLGIIVP